MSGREYTRTLRLDAKTTAVVSEPNEQGWSTVLETGLWYGEPVVTGTEILTEDGVRCPNRKCRKKLAEELVGTLVMTCRYCGQRVTITR